MLNWKSRGGLLRGFFVACAALAACSSEPSVNLEDPKLIGIRWGMSEQDVLERLGTPTRVETDLGVEVGYGYGDRYVGFALDPERVASVSNVVTTRPGDCFAGGLCIGDTLDVARAALGPAELFPAAPDKPALLNYLAPEHEACWLWIMTEDGATISELRMACQP